MLMFCCVCFRLCSTLRLVVNVQTPLLVSMRILVARCASVCFVTDCSNVVALMILLLQSLLSLCVLTSGQFGPCGVCPQLIGCGRHSTSTSKQSRPWK